MYIFKSISVGKVFLFTWHHIIWINLWMTSVALFYKYCDLDWLTLPWLPLSVIGTAVAFYVGFKNNNAYDRMWEARKIWGGIVNSSRAWGSSIKGFVTDRTAEELYTDSELHSFRQKMISRHIAWLYALRSQLLVIAPWEHANQRGMIGVAGKRYRKMFGVGLVEDEVTKIELEHFLPSEEYERLIHCQNTATQIIDQQSEDLKILREKGLIDDFRHMQLQSILGDFYTHQGKCKRIKKFPLPRQYGNMSSTLVTIFIFLLPFGMITEFMKLGEWAMWLSVPITSIVAWVYVMMEITGDYSENPFQGMANDIPMLSMCRSIEIDLREMLGEKELPPAIQAKNGILM